MSPTPGTPEPGKALVGVVMGSRSDWETMRHAAEILDGLGIPYEAKVVSAHRTPERLFEYGRSAEGRGIEVIIAGAGGAAHLPGMLAAISILPVLGVPVESKMLKGVDSLLSIVQMPRGVPVGTLAIGPAGAANAGLLAAAILARQYPAIREALADVPSRTDRGRGRVADMNFQLARYAPSCGWGRAQRAPGGIGRGARAGGSLRSTPATRTGGMGQI